MENKNMRPPKEYRNSPEDWERAVRRVTEAEGTERGGSPSVRPSFYAILADVMEQVEYSCFDEGDKQIAKELCLVIAEVFSLPDAGVIRICGVEQSAGTVKEVFAVLGHEHLISVAEKFRALPYRVRNIKAYLRAALYNSAFELTAGEENEISALFSESAEERKR